MCIRDRGKLKPLNQGGGLYTVFVAGSIQCALEVVIDRKHVAGEFGASELFGLTTIPL